MFSPVNLFSFTVVLTACMSNGSSYCLQYVITVRYAIVVTTSSDNTLVEFSNFWVFSCD